MSARSAVCYGTRIPYRNEENRVAPPPSFEEELDAINRELRKSFLKLQSLLEKKRRSLEEAVILEDKREQEQIETVIREIEKKIREIRGIGLTVPLVRG